MQGRAKRRRRTPGDITTLARLLEGVFTCSAALLNSKQYENEVMQQQLSRQDTPHIGKVPATSSTAEDPHCARTSLTLQDVLRQLLKLHPDICDDQLYSHLINCYSPEDLRNIKETTRQQSMCQQWKDHRVGMITASIAYRVYTRVNSVWTQMGPHDVRPILGAILQPSNRSTKAMRAGLAAEKDAKTAFAILYEAHHTGVEMRECGLIIYAALPYILATPDGIIKCECCGHSIPEVKCPQSLEKFIEEAIRRNELRRQSEAYTLKETSQYYGQVQAQMGVTGPRKADFFVYESMQKMLVVSVMISDNFFQTLLDRSVFPLNHVLPMKRQLNTS